uniref:Fatty acyl-CoA reductase n=1 Tax=Graphocephala atropunctata TaxID=36148 RepID=A0A1B6KTI1_9HEMI
MLPKICTHLAKQNVLVTGATGFVGLALVEKLLRTVPNIGTIYLLIRPKHGKRVSERLEEIKESSIFERLINSGHASALDKLVALDGFIDEADYFGMSTKDTLKVLSNVNYVFHCAATLDFEANLKRAVNINVLGTRNVVDLCKKLPELKVLVHVSSAYCNADQPSANEILYPPPENIQNVLELIHNLSNEELANATKGVLKDHPNTYTFTKALAEHEVAKTFALFPSCIIRPSMIVGAWKQPIPGWTNSKNGITGFLMCAGMGVVRRMPVAKDLVYDYIPIDLVVNTMIAGAVFTVIQQHHLLKTPIFQCTSSTQNPFRWAMVEHLVPGLLHKYPLVQAIWYPHLELVASIRHYRISACIIHVIPAHIFDFLTRLSGGRPKLVKLHSTINKSLDKLEPFIFKEWKFDNNEVRELHKYLIPEDKAVFGLDMESLEWEPFFEDLAKGVRRYLHKEQDDTLEHARKRDRRLKVANIAVQLAIFILLLALVQWLFDFHKGQVVVAIPFLYAFCCFF